MRRHIINETLITTVDLKKWIPKTFIISPNNRHVAYICRDGRKFYAVFDGLESDRYDTIVQDSFTFSPDGNKLAFVAALNNRYFVVIDGKESKHYEDIGKGSLTFSPDGSKVGYVVKELSLIHI
ncbi:MAG: hypothetical protein N3A59_07625, partial [Thermodesulfovibrionales bacterium]|nr:hypothetical protein [Thermodesulfovibrionales bacterium]